MSICVIDELILRRDSCKIHGKRYPVYSGSWSFYIPGLELKLLHAFDGRTHCTHPSTPDRARLFDGREVPIAAYYTREDWKHALTKDAIARAAEMFIASKRLHKARIGPATSGLAVVKSFKAEYTNPCHTAGIFVENLHNYARKDETSEDEMLRANVTPDRIRSCLRQQINGYISDLNSVVGVMPKDADRHVSKLVACMRDSLNRSE